MDNLTMGELSFVVMCTSLFIAELVFSVYVFTIKNKHRQWRYTNYLLLSWLATFALLLWHCFFFVKE